MRGAEYLLELPLLKSAGEEKAFYNLVTFSNFCANHCTPVVNFFTNKKKKNPYFFLC